MVNQFGGEGEILIRIKHTPQDEFGQFSLMLNSQEILNEEGSLSFLYVDLDALLRNIPNYLDDYFWKIKDEEITSLWMDFFNAKTMEELALPRLADFNDKLFNSILPLKSTFFDRIILVGFLNNELFHLKLWNKNQPKEVRHYKLSLRDTIDTLSNTIQFLSDEVLRIS